MVVYLHSKDAASFLLQIPTFALSETIDIHAIRVQHATSLDTMWGDVFSPIHNNSLGIIHNLLDADQGENIAWVLVCATVLHVRLLRGLVGVGHIRSCAASSSRHTSSHVVDCIKNVGQPMVRML